MKAIVMQVSPALASEWLSKNTCNRKLRPQYVMKLAADIIDGKWIMTGDAIRFSDVRLIDGQHRLHAIVKSGVTVETLVIFDLPDVAFNRIDQNKTRSSADILLSHGIHNPTACASIYKTVLAYAKGGASLKLQAYDTPTASDILEQMSAEYRHAGEFGNKFAITGALPASIIGASFLLCGRIDKNLARLFWESVGSGEYSNGLITDNARRLRDRLLSHAAAARSSRLTNEHKFTWCVRAWNAERSGVTLPVNGLKFIAGDNIPRFI